jgi:SAM-dependent methyltransferase
MAAACPAGLDTGHLKEEVMRIYAEVASVPSGEFHFHRGPAYAAELLGYDRETLAQIPAEATASFAGVANPHVIHRIAAGETVLDVGCGAGMDLLLAARSVGPGGRVVGVDLTEAMRRRAASSARALGFDHVDVRAGDALELPVQDSSIDVVISNGVLNLVPDKKRAFEEIVRVLKPGGRLQLGDIVVARELSEAARSDIDLWTG